MDEKKSDKKKPRKEKKNMPFIQVIGGDTGSEAAKRSMELLQKKIKKMEEDAEKGEQYADFL